MKYIVTTTIGGRGENRLKIYHCDEPVRKRNEVIGGFDHKVSGAIIHDDMSAAKTTRNRLQKFYPDFKMYISTFEDKEIFIGILQGTLQ